MSTGTGLHRITRRLWQRVLMALAAGFLLVAGVALLAVPDVARSQSNAPRPPKIELEKVFKAEGGAYAVAWSPDGKLLVVGHDIDRHITIWDYASQKPLHTIARTVFGYHWYAFTPDGRTLITSAVAPQGATNRTAFSLIDVQTGKVVRDVDGPVARPTHVLLNIARRFAFAPGRYAAITTADADHDYVSFYETNGWSRTFTHQQIGSEKSRFAPADIAANPANGQIAVLGVAGEVELWDPSQNRSLRRFQAHTNSGKTLAFSPSGVFLATSEAGPAGSRTPDPEPIRLWNTESWQLVASASGGDLRARALSFSADGRYLASLGYDGKVRLWNGATLFLIQEIRDGGEGGIALAFAPDSRRLAVARNTEVRIVAITPRDETPNLLKVTGDAEMASIDPPDCIKHLQQFVTDLDALMDRNPHNLEPFWLLLGRYFPLQSCNIDDAITIARKSKYLKNIHEYPNHYVFVFNSAVKMSPPWSGSGFDVSFGLSKDTGNSRSPFAKVNKGQ